MQERLDENPCICDEDEAAEECFIGTIDVTKECAETEEEDVSSDDEDSDPAEEPVEEPIVEEEETKVSSLQAAIAAMKTTDTEIPESNKKKTAPIKKNGVTGKNFSGSVKKKNTFRKVPAQKAPRGVGKSTFNSRSVKGKTNRAPAPPYAGKRKPPVIRKSSKTSEKKKQPKEKAAPRKGRSSKPPRADEKTSLRHRFVIGETSAVNQ